MRTRSGADSMTAYRQQANDYVFSPEERERLILEHMPQVKLIARRIHETLPGNVCLDDLVSSGVVGLIMAIDNYKPEAAVKLKTYAEYKIRGAILDSLRGMDWAPRRKRRQAKQIEAAISKAEQRLHRPPTDDEIAVQLDIPIEEYHQWQADTRGLNIGSLEYAGVEEGKDLLQYIPDDGENLPSLLLEKSELTRLLAEGIDGIP